MSSPFPGIDPYLASQGFWQDFHLRYMLGLCDAISDLLPEPYVARIDERMRVMEVPAQEVRQFRPDVAVVRRGGEPASGIPAAGTLTLEPELIPLRYLDEVREAFIEVVHLPDRRLVTVIEVLSPSNKSGSGRSDYLAKRNALIHQDVHIVELDFLVAGQRLPMKRALPHGDYFAFVARADRRPDCEVFAWSIRRVLPTIPIPLLAPDPDLLIDLGPIYASVYQRARYGRSIDYKASLTLPLTPEDLGWVEVTARRETL